MTSQAAKDPDAHHSLWNKFVPRKTSKGSRRKLKLSKLGYLISPQNYYLSNAFFAWSTYWPCSNLFQKFNPYNRSTLKWFFCVFFNFSVILSFDFWLGYKILLGWKCPSKFFESWTFYLITFVTNGASFRRVVFLETFIRTKRCW